MTQDISEEMHAARNAMTPGDLGIHPFQVLDICMAPGGFTWGSLKHNPSVVTFGITLPTSMGGYENLVPLA
jgi:hypothetical protein